MSASNNQPNSACTRSGMRWTVTECLKLNKLFDAGSSIGDIAKRHKRTNAAILHKLYAEELISQNTFNESMSQLGINIPNGAEDNNCDHQSVCSSVLDDTWEKLDRNETILSCA